MSELKYIACEDCGEEAAVNIGGNGDYRGWQWECAECGHVWWCAEAPDDD